jgi:hypothetical protein
MSSRTPLALLAAGALAACSRSPPAPHAPGIAADPDAVVASVDSTPPGAQIFLDGADTGQRTPARLTVETGREHRVALRHPEHREYATTFFAAPHTPVEVKAALPPGAVLYVTSDPAGAQVQIDGEPPFTAPGRSVALSPGKHVVFVRAPGRVTSRHVLELAEGVRSVSVALKPGRDAEVKSRPEGGFIFLDGADTGLLTPAVAVLPLGRGHRLEVRKPRFATVVRRLPDIKPGPALRFELTLEGAAAKALDRQIADTQKRLAQAKRALARLSRRQSGLVLKRSTEKGRALEIAVREQQDLVEELGSELSRLRQERLEEMGQPASPFRENRRE